MSLPANVDTGLVTGRFLVGVIDGPDPDSEPEGLPAQGTVTFTASVPYLPNPLASPAPVTILKAPIVARLDSEGYLTVPDGTRGVRLVATDDEDLSVQGWTWTVTYTFESVNGVRPQIASHSMALPGGSSVDLTSVVRVPSSTGIGIEQAEALAASAQTAAAAAADAAALAAQAAQPTDTGVATLVTYGGATTNVLDTQYRRDVSPAEFGAIGDGVADDTTAVRAVIQSGRSIHWGGPEKVYRITEPITATLPRPTKWRADGATILGDFPSQVERMLTIQADGHAMTIEGPFTIDAGDTAQAGLRAWNWTDTRAPLVLTDVTVQNIRRTTNAFPGCDGFQLAGSWSRIAMTRTTCRNIVIAAGVPVDATVGATGISVYGINRGDGSARTPGVVTIDEPFIENVYAEDESVELNQNGMRLFAGDATPGQVGPTDTVFRVTGGEIRDIQGRAIKFQAENATVDGTRIIRTKNGKGISHDIDFQFGGGTARNIECRYEDGNVPTSVVNFSGARAVGKVIPQRQVSGLKVTTTGVEQIDRLVSILISNEDETMTTISDVTAYGTPPVAVVMMSSTLPDKVQRLAATNIIASPTECMVRLAGGGSTGWDADLAITSAINPGPVVPLVVTAPSAARAATVTAALRGYTV